MKRVSSSNSEQQLSAEEKASRLYTGEALAPMVRASTTPLRALALRYGADFVYTEELVDRCISGTIRVENTAGYCVDYVKDVSKLSKKVQRRLERNGGGPALILRIDPAVESGRLVCQIGTGEPELALEAAMHVHRDVNAIDVNMGCPKKFSISGGMGSALLTPNPDRACRIIRTLSQHMTPRGVPVSCKIRLLDDAKKTFDFVQAVIDAGANAVAIHGRRVGHQPSVSADWDTLREVVVLSKSKFPSVPILVNGDFYTRDEFTQFVSETNANGVLLARPALYNTSIFRKPTTPTPPTATSATVMDGAVSSLPSSSSSPCCRYGYDSDLLLNKTVVVQDYLREAVKYDTHYKNAKYVISEMMNNRRAPTVRVPHLPQKYNGGQTIFKTCSCQSLQDLCDLWDVDYHKYAHRHQQQQQQQPHGEPECSETRLLQQQHQQEQMPAGEHRYSDSYFLGGGTAAKDDAVAPPAPPPAASRDEDCPPSKRVRVETASSL